MGGVVVVESLWTGRSEGAGYRGPVFRWPSRGGSGDVEGTSKGMWIDTGRSGRERGGCGVDGGRVLEAVVDGMRCVHLISRATGA